MSYDIYTGLLKAFPLPATMVNDVHFSYKNNHPKFDLLKRKHPIEAIAGDGDDFSKAKNLLNWVSGHIYHKGDFNGEAAYNSLDLLDHSFDKGSSCGINCVGLATILAESLLAIGLKARKVFIMPCSPYDGDNHVVTHVYIREKKKWVMFDPTYNAFFMNEQGECLSLLELRANLADQKPVFINDEAKYNDEIRTPESVGQIIGYFAKNLFYFQTSEISTFGDRNAINNRFISLSPHGFDPRQIRLSNIEYRIRKYGDSPNIQKWLKWAKREEYAFCSTVAFERRP